MNMLVYNFHQSKFMTADFILGRHDENFRTVMNQYKVFEILGVSCISKTQPGDYHVYQNL